jgi:hypothetical protein
MMTQPEPVLTPEQHRQVVSVVTGAPTKIGATVSPTSKEILAEADRIIHGERAAAYGPAEDSFARIGALWTVHLSNKLPEGKVLDAYDVAVMMTLMKCARAQTDVKRDTFVDIAGYAALSERCAAKAGRA